MHCFEPWPVPAPYSFLQARFHPHRRPAQTGCHMNGHILPSPCNPHVPSDISSGKCLRRSGQRRPECLQGFSEPVLFPSEQTANDSCPAVPEDEIRSPSDAVPGQADCPLCPAPAPDSDSTVSEQGMQRDSIRSALRSGDTLHTGHYPVPRSSAASGHRHRTGLR